MRTVGGLILSLALLAWLGLLSQAVAQSGSALVLEKTGATAPDVQPYSEVPVGVTVSLQPGARLVFLHYQTCRTVTAVGGTVTFGGLTYTITGGNKPEEVRTPCPPTVRLRGQSEMAGVLMRTISPEVRLSLSPVFALVGARADDFASVRLWHDAPGSAADGARLSLADRSSPPCREHRLRAGPRAESGRQPEDHHAVQGGEREVHGRR